MTHVLLVDDDTSIVSNLRTFLNQEGFQVTSANNQKETIDLLDSGQYHFDLALLDVSLPDGSGFSLCSAIKANSDIPVIFSFYNTLFHILYKTEKKRQILRCPLKTKFDITSSKDSTQFLTLFPTELSFLYFPIIRTDIFILPIFQTKTIPDRTKPDKTKSFIQMSCMHIGCTLFFLIDHFCLYKYFENPLL